MVEFLEPIFLDLVIVVLSLTVIISSFFRPTFRYIRWLVGLFISFIAVFLFKAVDFFNFIETYFSRIMYKLKFDRVVEKVVELFKGEMAQSKLDAATNLGILCVFAFLVFVLVNIIMGLSHWAKVRRSNKKGNYVYNSPVGSFFLSLTCVLIGIVAVTIAFKTVPFTVDYVAESRIMTLTYKVLTKGFNFIHSLIPAIKPFEYYIELLSNVRVA